MRGCRTFILATLMPLVLAAEEPRPQVRPADLTPQAEARPNPRPEEADPQPEAETRPSSEPGEPGEPGEENIGAATPEQDRSGVPMRDILREDDFSYSACLLELTLLGADFSEETAVTEADHPQCGIARPLRLKSPLPGIEIDGGALMRCDTARHLAHWLRDFVRPATTFLPGQPRLVGLEPGSTYQCRPTIGNGGEKLSEHAFGNALDIAAFRFQDGSRIEIGIRKDDGDMAEAFQRAVRSTACLYFTTVLGPGANAAHEDHLHLDIKARSSDFRLCQ